MIQDTTSSEPGFHGLENIGPTPVAPAHAIAAIALNMAIKFHDINTVQDGTLYQQYKLEGRNMSGLHLDMVFETAIRIERHLLASSERIAKIVFDAISVNDDPDSQNGEQKSESAGLEESERS
jgi:hypothetical protein